MVQRGLVLGCGGTVGGAWQVGALAAVEDALGWDARTAEVIVGTSAGATAATVLGSGISVDEMVAAHYDSPSARDSLRRFCTVPPRSLPALPLGLPSLRTGLAGLRRGAIHQAAGGLLPPGRTDPGFLDDLVDDLVPDRGWVRHPGVRIVATALPSGDRVVFGAADAPRIPLRDAVRASWAIPGWYPPVTVEGRRYVDGGLASTASADVLDDAELDEVVVVAPMASSDGAHVPGALGLAERLLRIPMSRTLRAEIDRLESAGTRVRLVCPGTAELAVMGPNFMDPGRRLPALEAALAHVPERIAG